VKEIARGMVEEITERRTEEVTGERRTRVIRKT
jgi:hypothetical protein